MISNHASGEQLGMPFQVHKDRHGNEYKVIDLNHDTFSKGEGSIMFEAIGKKNKKNSSRIPFKMVKDKLTGIYIGIWNGTDQRSGDPKWVPIYVGDGSVFNLEIREEAQKCAVLLRSSIVEDSPNVSEYGKLTMFRVHDELVAAKKTITKIADSVRAFNFANGLVGDKLKNMARNLGIAVDHANETILLAAVLDRASKNPSEFLKVYENPNLERITTFNKAVNLAVITHDPFTGYHFRGAPLGINENFVIEYFKKYPDIQTSIDMICEEKAHQSKQSNSIPVKVDEEKEKLYREIAELKAKLNDVPQDLEKELEELKAEAARIGGTLSQGLHAVKPTRDSLDKLKAKIEKAKQEA